MNNYEQEILQYVKENIDNFNWFVDGTLIYGKITIKKGYTGKDGYDECYKIILEFDDAEEIIHINLNHSLNCIIKDAMDSKTQRNIRLKSFVETYINKGK